MEKRKEKESSSETDRLAKRAIGNALDDMYESLRTVFQQDYEAWIEAKKRGLDVTKSFRVMRLGNEGEDPHYHIFTTEGEEERTEEELNVMNTSRMVIDNRSVPRYRLTEEEKEMLRVMVDSVDKENDKKKLGGEKE